MKKHIFSLSIGMLIGAVGVSSMQAAELNGDFRTLRSNVETQFDLALSAYDATIQALLNENRALKAELEKLYKNKNISLSMERQKITQRWDLINSPLSASGVIQVNNTATPTKPTTSPTATGVTAPVVTGSTSSSSVSEDSSATTTTSTSSKVLVTGDAFVDKVIKNILSQESKIKSLYFSDESTWGIQAFEFVDQKAVYIDFHITNPSGPYIAKVLLSLGTDGTFDITKPTGVFTLDSASQRYITKQGSNPYSSVTNRRVFSITAATSTTTSATGSVVTSVAITEFDTKIKNYYQDNARGKTGVSAAVWQELIRLSNEYITLAPSNLEPYRYRYRAHYMLGNTNQALTDILRITDAIDPKETANQPFFCNAYKIAQAAGNTQVQAKLRPIVDTIGCQ